jgi:outer membrane receptor protein involved in Fe transport
MFNKCKILPVISLLLAFWYLPINIFCQEKTGVSGFVLDSRENIPVESASVKLFYPDSSLAGGSSTSKDGMFLIEGISAGEYRLEVSFIGFRTFKNNITVSQGKVTALDTISLVPSKNSTDEIIVEGDKSLLEFDADKKIFNVDESMVTKGGNALDVLKRVPLVAVDINDNVSLRGSSNVTIWVNGKPSKLFENLKQLPSDMIEKIELITNPSAKYDSEGTAGIINIVLKKDSGFGMNGTINLSGSTKNNYYGSGSLNMKKEKITLFSGISYGFNKNDFSNSSTRENYVYPVSVIEQSGETNDRGNSYYFSGGLEYETGPNSSLGIDGSYNNSSSTGKGLNQSSTRDSAGSLASSFLSNTQRENEWKNMNFSAYYFLKFQKQGQELNADFNYSRSENSSTLNAGRDNYDYVNSLRYPSLQIDLTEGASYNLNFKIDYSHPLGEKSSLETGYKGIIKSRDDNFNSDTLDFSRNIFVNNASRSNHFIYKEQIHSAYALLGSRLDEFKFKLGLRLEYTLTGGNLVTNNTVFDDNYLSISPSINISRKLGGNNEIQLSYARRLNRPSVWRLNPFIQSSDPLNISYGNPFLKPEYTNSLELSYLTYINTISVTPSIFYKRTNDVISRYSFLDSNVRVSTFKNLSNSTSYGADLIFTANLDAWNINSSVSFYKTAFESGDASVLSNDGYSWRGSFTAGFPFFEIAKVQLSYSYYGSRVSYQGSSRPSQNLDIALSKSFFDKSLSVSLRVNDLLKLNTNESETYGEGFRQTITSSYDSRSFYFNISYLFGSLDKNYKKKKKGSNVNEGPPGDGD